VARGPNIMQGYLFHGGDGELMPPWTERGKDWYDTGDIVVADEDRFVTILGRQKCFANLGGEMVSLTSTEDVANAVWPGHNHAAVAIPDSRKGEQIILANEFTEATRGELVSAAKELKVSELAIPKSVVHLEEIPLLGSGKLNFPAPRDLVIETLAK
jgi:acyl-[acyl-carrier-protein]-phospholipid O-acyltransferase / long-chain-fatty-acid--[acyl-carrier-protein] ligase